uniref:Ig-like domain-containing protein n=1 Tax=Varanus komodoensis TaxID=61221 RepID=A0A8D2KVQ5_VARKO
MLWVPLFLMLLTYCTGVSTGTYVLTQPPFVSVPLEQKAQISCSGNSIEDHSVQWYQQKPDQAPVLIIYADDSSTNPGNTATLTITGAQAEAEANYYCQVWEMFMNGF